MAGGLQDIFEGEHIIGRIYVYGELLFHIVLFFCMGGGEGGFFFGN